MARNYHRPIVHTFLQFLTLSVTLHSSYGVYIGKFIGKLSELHHGVSGEVYAVDARTLILKDFTYDGQGPAAYFYAGSTRSPGVGGFRLTDENGSPEVIRRYRKENVILTLPEGKTLNSIKWFSVWCEEFTVNFGDVKIPRNFDYPRPRKVDALRGVHGVSSDNIAIVDAQTLLVPNFSYDGEAPDAKFWVGRGSKPSPQGIRVPDENGKEEPLRRYDRKTVVLTLPGDLTIFDIGHFGIWCEAFTVDFGHIQIPPNMNVPPSLRMLGVSPQSKLNCEVLLDDLAFQVRWAIAGDIVVLQLVSKLDEDEYMSFGISGDDSKTEMVGGDVAVAWIDKNTLKGHVDDYYLQAKSQCSGPSGSCPDNKFKVLQNNTNSVTTLYATIVNGYSIVTYKRPLRQSDEFDKEIYTNASQPIIWAIGPLNQRDEVSFHSRWIKKNHFINFGRFAKWNCPMPEAEQPLMKMIIPNRSQKFQEIEDSFIENVEPPQLPTNRGRKPQRRRGESNRGSIRQETLENISKDSERAMSRTRQSVKRGPQIDKQKAVPSPAPASKKNAWEIPAIQCYEPEDGVFYAQMGPTGGKRGYPAITGHVGWGISWYINGLLIPEINVVRGKTYTFVVEGGSDPETPAKYHPFYITDDPIGGYEHKTPEEKAKIKVFAGVRLDRNGNIQPTGTGRLCHWTYQGENEADDFESFGAYQRSLELKCDQGEPGVVQFTPDHNTPNTIYYQCFTHRHLGWKINVLDNCDGETAASEKHASVAPTNTDFHETDIELDDSPSVRVETKVDAPNMIVETENKNAKFTKIILNSNENQRNVTNTVTPTQIIPNHLLLYESSFNENLTKPFYDYIPESMIKMVAPPFTDPTFTIKPIQMAVPLFKKPLYKSIVKSPVLMKFPYKFEEQSMHVSSHLRPVMIPLKYVKKSSSHVFLERPVTKSQLEISLEQPSTEKESRPTTAKTYTPLIQVTPSKTRYNENMPMAVNTGFRPESIVIESGFKPIVSKDVQNRKTKVEGPELKYESEIGIIDVNQERVKSEFVPFPLDKSSNKNTLKNILIKEDGADIYDDEISDADERVDSYYLPPDNQRAIPTTKIIKPSNIDVAPGTVVSYDGRKVSGASLTPKYPNRGSILEAKTSATSELLKTRPQFGPFKGDLPPLDPHFLSKIPTQFQFQRVLSRNLETPSSQDPTKLVLVN
ncbi:hypothetical protein FQR65_LT10223 [Abscondita terminalis]|nr:hypothetical protein FQR65_LT10223 [Abscondita terminalis]